MYYAYDMQKRAKRKNKKHLLIVIISLIVLLGAAAGGFYWYTQQQAEQARQQQQLRAQVQEEVDKTAFRGDNQIAVDYVFHVKQGNTAAANQVFVDAVSQADSDAQKIQLHNQHITLALEYDLPEQALQASLGANALGSTHLTLAEVARRYEAVGNTAQAGDYWQQAIDALEDLPANANIELIEQDYRTAMNSLTGAQ